MSADELRKAAEALQAARASFNRALAAHQETCNHTGAIIEAPHRTGLIFDTLPSRACERCGVWEQGWSAKVLTGRAYPASDTEVLRARVSPTSDFVPQTIVRLINGGAA